MFSFHEERQGEYVSEHAIVMLAISIPHILMVGGAIVVEEFIVMWGGLPVTSVPPILTFVKDFQNSHVSMSDVALKWFCYVTDVYTSC